ncbi:NAD dependent epimerase/dehydratase family protein [Mycobacterium kansasii]|uniref:NAD dependent epimerase/dehydratase family protein n=1 Tax=Mycobacterium kansasii TaxID=1768 RepID=A0A1V3WH35_MYCKA|nr:NAD dependent epimerase/dehydratase family protein [Mycobacterium kansasii]
MDVRDGDALAPLLAGWTWSVTRRRWWVPGWTPPTRRIRRPQRPGHHGVTGPDVRRRGAPPGAGVVDGGLRQGRYHCGRHGLVDPLPRRRADLDSGIFEHRCPACGDPVRWRLVDEAAAVRPRSLYAASKAAQEHYALAWSESTGGSVVALRYHNVYGPGMPRDTPYSGVAAIFRSSLEKGEPPRVFEDGGQMRDFVHVDDVAAANLAAADLTAADRGGFTAANVCSGRPISILQVAIALCEARGDSTAPVITGQYRSGDVRHIVADPARAADVLGFRAAVARSRGCVISRSPRCADRYCESPGGR